MNIERLLTIPDRKTLFPLKRNAAMLELDTDCPMINRLDEPRSQGAVYGDATTDHAMGQLFRRLVRSEERRVGKECRL